MSISRFLAASGFLVSTIVAAQADGLKPIEAQTIALSGVTGVAYYTTETDGYHVVATVALADKPETPLRIQTVLSPGQSVIFSTPGSAGAPSTVLELSRGLDGGVFVARRVNVD